MSNKKELVKNTMIIAIGKFSTQVVTFLLMPLYTYILTTSEYGMYDFITTLVALIIPVITLLMEESMFRFLIDANEEDEKKLVISQSIIFISFMTFVSIIIFIVIFIITKNILTIYFLFYLIASIMMSIAQAISRGINNIRLYSISSFISGSLVIILNIVMIVYLRLGTKGLLISFILSNFITSIFILKKLEVCKYIDVKNLNSNQMKSMIKYSLPLVPNSISWVIISLSDRLIITSIIGLSANGIYAISNKFPSIINTFYNFFYTAWKESAAKVLSNESRDEYYNSIYLSLKRFLFGATICLLSILPFVFNILVDSNYKQAYIFIPILSISILFSNLSGFYGGIFSAYKDTKIMGTTTIFAAIINIIINILFIKIIGLYAAVFSTFISNVSVCLYRVFKIKKYIKFENDSKFYIQSIIIFIFINITYYSQSIIGYIVGIVLALIYSVYINKEMLKIIYICTKKRIFKK